MHTQCFSPPPLPQPPPLARGAGFRVASGYHWRTLLCRSSERLSPLLKVTKLLPQVCLNPPNTIDLGGEAIPIANVLS